MITKNNTIKLIKKLKEIHPETEWKKTSQEILYSQIKSSEIHANISLLSQLYDVIERIAPIKKLAYSVLTLLFVLISGSIISVRASENSMPGDFFYNVKLIKEGISLKLSPKDKRMGLRMKFAQKRLSEVNKIIANNKGDKKQEKINLAVNNLNKDLNDVKNKLAKIDTSIAEGKTIKNINKTKPLTKAINNKNVNKAVEKKELNKVKKPLKNNKKTNNQDNTEQIAKQNKKTNKQINLADNIKEVQKLVERKDFKDATVALTKISEQIKGLDLENLIQKSTEEQAKTIDKDASTTASTTITNIATTTNGEVKGIDSSSENNASSVTPDLLNKTNKCQ